MGEREKEEEGMREGIGGNSGTGGGELYMIGEREKGEGGREGNGGKRGRVLSCKL